MIFFFLLNLMFASNYSDFIDAIYYEKNGDYLQSYKIIEKINYNEKDIFLNKYLYELALKGFRSNQISIDELKRSVENIIKIESNNPDNWILYASIKAQEGDTDGAKKAYEKAIEIDPKNIEAYYQLALIESKNTDKSLYYFNKIIEIDPSLASDVYYNIAVLYSLKKDTKKVNEYISKAIKADPKSLKPYYFMALYWEEIGDFKKMLEAYQKIIAIEPQNTEALLRLAELYISTGSIELAEVYLKNVLSYDPSNSKALWWMSLIEEDRKNYQKAIEYLSQIEGWDSFIENNVKMSYYNLMIGKMDIAVDILKKAYEKWPQNPEIAYYLGLGMMDMSKYDEARKYFEIVISTKPNNYDVRYNLGVICEKLNDTECFKKNFGYILLKNPDDANVLNYLGYSLIDRNIVDEEILIDTHSLSTPFNMVQKALIKDPTNYAYLDSIAWGYFKKGEYLKAYENIEEAIKYMNIAKEYDPLVIEHKADILTALKRYDEAYLYYIEAFLNDTSNRRKFIKDSALKIVNRVSLEKIMNSISKYFPQSYSFFGEMKFSLKYRKFLKTKKFEYTFNFIISKKEKDFNLSVVMPLLFNLLEINFKNSSFYINSSFKLNHDYEERVKDVFIMIYAILNQNELYDKILNQDNSWILKDLYWIDKMYLSFKNNFIVFDSLFYNKNKNYYELEIYFNYDKLKGLLYPLKILVKTKDAFLEFEFMDFSF